MFYDSLSVDFRKRNLKGQELKEYKYQRFMRDYAKVLKTFDDNVGRLLDYLDKTGLSENTLVVYTSDQGFYMGEHGWFDKRFMYEESFSTPLVMRMPTKYGKHVATGDITEMVQNIDYAPTFLDLAGIPIPDDMQGVSLLPLLEGQHPKNWRQSLYYHYYEYPAEHSVRRHYGVRTADGYKLIHFYPSNEEKAEGAIDQWEMYDLNTDPTEMHNIYGQKGREKLQKRLHKELLRLQQQYDVKETDR
jgi:arylsulfatase A-like enzyme